MDSVMSAFMQLAVVLSFCFVVYVAHQKPSRLCNYVIIYSIAVFFNEFGYLMEIKSDNLSEALLAVKFEYLTGSAATIMALFFTLELFHIKTKLWFKLSCIGLFFISCSFVITNSKHHLHYISSSLDVREHFSALNIEVGPIYIYHTIISLSFMAACIAVVAVGWSKDKQRKETFLKYLLLVIAAMMPFFSVIIRFSLPDKSYDPIPFGLFCTDICFVLIIYFFHIFDVAEYAKNDVLENMEEGVLVCDEEGRVLFTNKKIRSIFADQSLQNAQEILLRLVPEADGEFRYRDRVYSVTESEVYRGDKAKGKTLCFIDVTLAKEKEQKLRELSEEAMAANKAKSNFLANMSHEIRTPINTILGMDEMILREGRDHAILSYANDIRSEGKTLLSLIDELLDFSKIESGNIQIKEKEYYLPGLLKEVLSGFAVKAKQKGLSFESSVAIDMPTTLQGDELRIYQVLNNLLGNALKYTEKGEISISVEWHLVDNKTAQLIFNVTDTGIGISQENLPYIYEKYSRLDSRKDSKVDGSGLGLNITKQLLDLMNGTIRAESEFGKGSSFTVKIPQKIIDVTPAGEITIGSPCLPEITAQTTFTAPDAKLLVVDDNVMNRIVVRNLLKRTLLQVEEAESGTECLEKTAQTHYDLILMDHMMQEMDGIEAMQRIRKQEGKCRETPIIVLTANAVSGVRDTYLEAGFDAYLSKPVSGEQLEQTLISYLPKELLLLRQINDPGANEDGGGNDEEASVNLLISDGIDVRNGLKNFLSREDLYKEAGRDFAVQCEEYLRSLQESLLKKDVEVMTGKLEMIRRNASALGATKLKSIAEELLQQAKQEDIAALMASFGLLSFEYQRVAECFSWVTEPSGNGRRSCSFT